MSNAFAHENTPASAYGEFGTFDLPPTDEAWHAYDAYFAESLAAYDAACEDDYVDFDPEPPF